MRFKTFKDFLTATRKFKKDNPKAVWRVYEEPKNVTLGLEALTNEGSNLFLLFMSTFKNRNNVLNSGEEKIIEDYLAAKINFHSTEKLYINMLIQNNE